MYFKSLNTDNVNLLQVRSKIALFSFQKGFSLFHSSVIREISALKKGKIRLVLFLHCTSIP